MRDSDPAHVDDVIGNRQPLEQTVTAGSSVRLADGFSQALRGSALVIASISTDANIRFSSRHMSINTPGMIIPDAPSDTRRDSYLYIFDFGIRLLFPPKTAE